MLYLDAFGQALLLWSSDVPCITLVEMPSHRWPFQMSYARCGPRYIMSIPQLPGASHLQLGTVAWAKAILSCCAFAVPDPYLKSTFMTEAIISLQCRSQSYIYSYIFGSIARTTCFLTPQLRWFTWLRSSFIINLFEAWAPLSKTAQFFDELERLVREAPEKLGGYSAEPRAPASRQYLVKKLRRFSLLHAEGCTVMEMCTCVCWK